MSGYKTYIGATCLVVFAILGQITGQLQPTETGQLFAQALGLIGIRHAIEKKW